MKHILTLTVSDENSQLKRLKGNDNTGDKYIEAGNTWDLENATKEALRQKQTLTKEDIHAINHHKSKVLFYLIDGIYGSA